MPKFSEADYDKAIARLVKHPDEIGFAWTYTEFDEHPHISHCLFQALTPTGREDHDNYPRVGCPTQIAAGEKVGPDFGLTMAVLGDALIPADIFDFETEVRALPESMRAARFASLKAIQMRTDKEIRDVIICPAGQLVS